VQKHRILANTVLSKWSLMADVNMDLRKTFENCSFLGNNQEKQQKPAALF
jgi:hypothetical protein